MLGKVYGLYQPFKRLDGSIIPAVEQAEAILAAVRTFKCQHRAAPGVMITYSANMKQTKHCNSVYFEQQKSTAHLDTNTMCGANQAAVIKELIVLLRSGHRDLANYLRIAPITTIGSVGHPFKNGSHRDQLSADFESLRGDLSQGYNLLLWVNDPSQQGARQPTVAIGGGVAGNLSLDIQNQIQEGCKALYSSPLPWISPGSADVSSTSASPTVRRDGRALPWWKRWCCCASSLPAEPSSEEYKPLS